MTIEQVKATEPAPMANGRNGVAKRQNGHILDPQAFSADGQLVTEAEYWAHYYDRSDFSYEWNNGRLEVKPMADYAQFQLYLWFLSLLKDYLHVNPVGRMIGLEVGFRLYLATRTTIRKPDLAIVLNSNAIPLLDKDRSYHGIFDLCIESLSDSSKDDVERDTITKRNEYAAAGVREYFILDERGVETAFYRLSARGIYLPIQPVDGVIRSQVLPGFQFHTTDLYRLPEIPALVTDDVYRAFASPFVRVERERAEQAEQRAARYAALLQSMGIDVNNLPEGA